MQKQHEATAALNSCHSTSASAVRSEISQNCYFFTKTFRSLAP